MVSRHHRQLDCPSCFWGAHTGRTPTDRGKKGSKRHLITDAQGVPLVLTHTGANVNDCRPVVELIDSIPAIQGPRGRPRFRPDRLQGDRGYDSNRVRAELRRRHIAPELAYRYTGHGSGLGKTRWVVERTHGWIYQFRRLRLRYEKMPQIHQALLTLASAMICWNFLAGL